MAEKTFEESLGEIQNIANRLSDGKASLNESIELYAQGMQLIASCRRQLDEAKNRIDIITRGELQSQAQSQTGGSPDAAFPSR